MHRQPMCYKHEESGMRNITQTPSARAFHFSCPVRCQRFTHAMPSPVLRNSPKHTEPCTEEVPEARRSNHDT